MNIPTPAQAQAEIALNNLVFRAADRMRIDGCANAVAHEGLSLALYCPFEALLDHYVNLLLARLRQQAPDHRIEVYFPANTDSLLGRFNEVLATQSLNQAVKATATVNPAQVWIVHDAHTLPESELQLLARLIQNFPGANIRAILLMSGHQNANKSPLSAFGRKILRWDLEAPTEEQAQAALELARHEGNFGTAQQLIQRIQRQQRPELDSPLQAALVATSADAMTTTNSFATTTAHQPAPSGVPANPIKSKLMGYQQHGAAALKTLRTSGLRLNLSSQWLRQNAKLVSGVAFALGMSTLMMLWIQPEAFGLKSTQALVTAPLKNLPLPTPTPVQTPESPALAAEPTPGTLTTAAPSTVGSTRQRVEPAIEAPEASQGGQTWLNKLDASSFLLQHGTSNSYEKVLDIQRKYPALKDAQIVAAYRPGEKLAHFVIVSGPFSEVGQGYEASKRPGIPRSWVRPTRSLQEQLKSPTWVTDARP